MFLQSAINLWRAPASQSIGNWNSPVSRTLPMLELSGALSISTATILAYENDVFTWRRAFEVC